jgi:hypothetical protein
MEMHAGTVCGFKRREVGCIACDHLRVVLVPELEDIAKQVELDDPFFGLLREVGKERTENERVRTRVAVEMQIGEEKTQRFSGRCHSCRV